MPQQKHNIPHPFDRKQAVNKLSSKITTEGPPPMSDLNKLSKTFLSVLSASDKIQWLVERITLLEAELSEIKKTSNESWVSLEKAAQELGKSVTAIRQRLKNQNKPMPKGKVWKQEDKGCAIYVHLKNYREYM